LLSSALVENTCISSQKTFAENIRFYYIEEAYIKDKKS